MVSSIRRAKWCVRARVYSQWAPFSALRLRLVENDNNNNNNTHERCNQCRRGSSHINETRRPYTFVHQHIDAIDADYFGCALARSRLPFWHFSCCLSPCRAGPSHSYVFLEFVSTFFPLFDASHFPILPFASPSQYVVVLLPRFPSSCTYMYEWNIVDVPSPSAPAYV